MEQTKKLEKDINFSSVKTWDVIYAITSQTDKAVMNLTDRFPHCSSCGNEYILIAYNFGANIIIGEPVQNHRASTLKASWRNLHQTSKNAGLAPNTWVLDNETSGVLKIPC